MHVRKNLLKSKDFSLHVKTFKQELSQFQSVKESEIRTNQPKKLLGPLVNVNSGG